MSSCTASPLGDVHAGLCRSNDSRSCSSALSLLVNCMALLDWQEKAMLHFGKVCLKAYSQAKTVAFYTRYPASPTSSDLHQPTVLASDLISMGQRIRPQYHPTWWHYRGIQLHVHARPVTFSHQQWLGYIYEAWKPQLLAFWEPSSAAWLIAAGGVGRRNSTAERAVPSLPVNQPPARWLLLQRVPGG